MPHLFPFASRESEDESHCIEPDDSPPSKRPRRTSVLKNLGGLWKRHRGEAVSEEEEGLHTAPAETSLPAEDYFAPRRPSLPNCADPFDVEQLPAPRAIPSLPRAQTLLRQESEKREKLLEVPTSPHEKRALSLDRRREYSLNGARRPLSPKPVPLPSVSAPDFTQSDAHPDLQDANPTSNKPPRNLPTLPPLQIPTDSDPPRDLLNSDNNLSTATDHDSLQEEYDRRWILNLSMHFRDKSNREKFFVTYAETPTKWRRLTVSLDYRNAPPDSLEADLSTLHYQRDKSFRIYEAIRESLPAIQYYNTVTNLKLETTPEDGQLHVHVREDANEIIRYPEMGLFEHVEVPLYPESEVEFISHLSGFVYKVQVEGRIVIKKEIPGPDTVDEFLYEVNALHALLGCRHVVELEGLVTDASRTVVKGLLISYAPNGALVDMIYDMRGDLPWHRREKWARQIVHGLSDIHEAGFVQGDFTLSNIVVDANDDVKIIDINRRGCPVGWEPPELGRLINSGQRIGMCIGVKTDLFQLGMVLWALAEEVDEPERVERPLPRIIDTAPEYFSKMVERCLDERPQRRSSAKHLLRHFPPGAGLPPSPSRPVVEFLEDPRVSDPSISSTTHRSDKEYIDPAMAITLEDVTSRHRHRNSAPAIPSSAPARQPSPHPHPSRSPDLTGQVQYLDPDSNPSSSTYPAAATSSSSGYWHTLLPHRGRSPAAQSSRRGRLSSPAYDAASPTDSSATSVSPSYSRGCSQQPRLRVELRRSCEGSRSRSPPPSRGLRRRGSDASDLKATLRPVGLEEQRLGLGIDFDGSVGPAMQISEAVAEPPALEEQEWELLPRSSRVTALRERNGRNGQRTYEEDDYPSPPLHTDSGFDETGFYDRDGESEEFLDGEAVGGAAVAPCLVSVLEGVLPESALLENGDGLATKHAVEDRDGQHVDDLTAAMAELGHTVAQGSTRAVEEEGSSVDAV